MDEAEYIIATLNLFLGLGCGWPLARLLARVGGYPSRMFRLSAVLLGIYFIECVAISISMGTCIFCIGLAFLWGFGFGLFVRRIPTEKHELVRVVSLFSIYTSLPAASLISIPIVAALGGWPIIDTEWGLRFGIPDFVPWPLNTILGFFVVVALVTVLLKVAITTGLACLIIKKEDQAKIDL